MSSPLESSIAFYAALFAGISAVASMIAAFSSLRSSSAANEVIKAQKQGEKRHLALTLARLGQETISKARSLEILSNEVKSQYDSLAIFTGGYGDSRHKLFTDRVEYHKDRAAEYVNENETLTG